MGSEPLPVQVERVRASSFRCYARLDVPLAPRLTVVVGRNGAGKTSLLEAIHFGCLGWSPRTADEARVVADGAQVTRVEVDARVGERALALAVGFRPGSAKRITVDGVRQRSAERLSELLAVLVFTPDRLAVVKGAPAIRRAYFDRSLARLWPRYGQVVADYGRVLSQRNHLLRRIRSGQAGRDSLGTWNGQLAALGAEVHAARRRLAERLAAPFGERLAELGGDPGPASLTYRPSGPEGADELRQELERRTARDVERAQTSVGPHLDDVLLTDRARDVRAFGSQGEQRTAVLALLLAESDLVSEVRGLRPLLLLDDVTSELDADRRARLLRAVRARGQAALTATQGAELAAAADLVLTVDSGQARAA